MNIALAAFGGLLVVGALGTLIWGVFRIKAQFPDGSTGIRGWSN